MTNQDAKPERVTVELTRTEAKAAAWACRNLRERQGTPGAAGAEKKLRAALHPDPRKEG